MQLYNLVGQINDLFIKSITEDLEGDVLKDTLESLEMETESKIDNIVKWIKNMQADVAALKEEEERLNNRRKSIENRISKIKEYLQSQISLLPDKKFKNSLFKVYIQKNPESLDIKENAIIPEDFKILQEPKIDKKGLLDWLKKGHKVIGIELKQTESIRIR
ncbi:MAG: siphovirus Gp157 family protein [Candidatus Thorarchaeota archaeon]